MHRGVLNMILVIFSSVKRVGCSSGRHATRCRRYNAKIVPVCNSVLNKVLERLGFKLDWASSKTKEFSCPIPNYRPSGGRPTMVEKTARGGSSPSNAHWSIVDHQRLSVTIHVECHIEKVLFPKKGTQLCISNSQAGLSGIMECLTHKTHNSVKYYNIEYLQHFNEVPQPRYCLMPINLISGYRHPQSDK